MSLNQSFFDKIQIELVKKKYYNANKVDALLAEIREQALAMSQENEQLTQALAKLNSQKAEISEAVMSAQLLCTEIVQKATRQAEDLRGEAETQAQQILADARSRADALIADARSRVDASLERFRCEEEKAKLLEKEAQQDRIRRQEYAVKNVEACFSRLREQYQTGLDLLNQHWQDFLSGLYEEDLSTDSVFQPTLPSVEIPPDDFSVKLQALADELEALSEQA